MIVYRGRYCCLVIVYTEREMIVYGDRCCYLVG